MLPVSPMNGSPDLLDYISAATRLDIDLAMSALSSSNIGADLKRYQAEHPDIASRFSFPRWTNHVRACVDLPCAVMLFELPAESEGLTRCCLREPPNLSSDLLFATGESRFFRSAS